MAYFSCSSFCYFYTQAIGKSESNTEFIPIFLMLQVTQSTDFNELADREPWLSSSRIVVKPDMLFEKRGKSGLVALNLDLAQVIAFVKECLGKEVMDCHFFQL